MVVVVRSVGSALGLYVGSALGLYAIFLAVGLYVFFMFVLKSVSWWWCRWDLRWVYTPFFWLWVYMSFFCVLFWCLLCNGGGAVGGICAGFIRHFFGCGFICLFFVSYFGVHHHPKNYVFFCVLFLVSITTQNLVVY